MSGCGQNTPGRDGPPGRRRHGGSFFDFSRRPKCGRRGHSEKAAVRRRQVAERDPTAGGKKKKKKRGCRVALARGENSPELAGTGTVKMTARRTLRFTVKFVRPELG